MNNSKSIATRAHDGSLRGIAIRVQEFHKRFPGLGSISGLCGAAPYFAPTPERDRLLASIRSAARSRARIATTFQNRATLPAFHGDNYIKVGRTGVFFSCLPQMRATTFRFPGKTTDLPCCSGLKRSETSDHYTRKVAG